MGKRIHIVLVSFLIVAGGSVFDAFGQEIHLSKEQIQKSTNLTQEEWRFHSGDSLHWADPNYDDSHWGLSETQFFFRDGTELPEWEGIGWYRLTVYPDSLSNPNVRFSIFQSGAFEMYLNGELVGNISSPSADSSHDIVANDVRFITHWNSGQRNTLAIRYSNQSALRIASIINRFQLSHSVPSPGLGFNIRVANHVNGDRRFWNNAIFATWIAGIFLGIFAISGILSLAISIFSQKDRGLTYLSVALLGSVTLFWIFGFMQFGEISAWHLSLFNIGLYLFFPIIAVLAYWGLYEAFFPGKMRTRNVTTGLISIMMVGSLFNYGSHNNVNETLFAFVFGIIVIEIIRLTVWGIWKRKQGAKILGTGFLLFLMAFAFSFYVPDQDGQVALFGTLTIPGSICVMIAYRYALSTKDLKTQLAKVELLSEENLKSEREKQALIEGQKEELERTVEERTAELKTSIEVLHATQAQLVEQEKLASLGSLTAGIAHEIKNPLNFVNNFAEVGAEMADELSAAIAKGDTEEAQAIVAELRENATQITKHGRRADEIVKAMMQHARGGASEMESVDLNSFLEEYANLAWHGRRAKESDFQAELVRDYSEHAGEIKAMPQELGRVILNLLNNAFDAVKDNEGAKVTIATRRDASGVHISVSDNGPGIPAEIRDKIFEPFFTMKPTGEGTGLGLSLSYDIVTKGHGGSLTVETEEGGGAKFVVSLIR